MLQPAGGANRRRADRAGDERRARAPSPPPTRQPNRSPRRAPSRRLTVTGRSRSPAPAGRADTRAGSRATGAQPRDVVEVHDREAADAHELPVGEALLPLPQRFRRRPARQMRGQAQRGAVALRVDGHDVARPDEDTIPFQGRVRGAAIAAEAAVPVVRRRDRAALRAIGAHQRTEGAYRVSRTGGALVGCGAPARLLPAVGRRDRARGRRIAGEADRASGRPQRAPPPRAILTRIMSERVQIGGTVTASETPCATEVAQGARLTAIAPPGLEPGLF